MGELFFFDMSGQASPLLRTVLNRLSGDGSDLEDSLIAPPRSFSVAVFPIPCHAPVSLLTTRGYVLHKRVDGFPVILKQ